MSEPRPLLGITMGDPAGIGPEVTVRAAMLPEVIRMCRALIIGDASVLRATAAGLGMDLGLHIVAVPAEGLYRPGTLDVLDLGNVHLDDLARGKISAMSGNAAYDYVAKAIDLAVSGLVDGIVTAPLNKEAMHLAGHNYPGHTEILAEKTGTREFTMMLASGSLRVSLVTIHVSLREAIELITQERVQRAIRLTDQALRGMGVANPRLAVCGLNPHAGEGGLFGREEIDAISPAIQHAHDAGMNVRGPFPGDTIFLRALQGEYDAVVAMYHDQGLIPLKTTGFSTGVNITLGLPIIRTSVDHGTAFDIAWEWRADHRSMFAAIQLAAQMVDGRRSAR